MSDDTETCVIAKGPRATGIVETLDQVEPDLMTFVRASARRLDSTFPMSGERGTGQRGQWTDDDGVKNFFTQVEEFDSQGRGIRVVRLMFVGEPAGEPHPGAITIAAIGLANDAKLTLRWDFITSGEHIRGTSAALFVAGTAKEDCIADFRDLFDVLTS